MAQSPVPLPQQAYIWQRAWNDPVRDALAQHGSNFDRIVVLAAEISWPAKQPAVVHVPLDYAALAKSKTPVGLALRIGSWAGPFSPDDASTQFVTGLAASLVAEATNHGVVPRELQIDFDCAESKLDGYREWLGAIRRKIGPMALTITALPAWLNQKSFQPLVAATDGYVLQVHSLERPKDVHAAFTLCDPAAAIRAVERAGKLDVPFRVALPTYGYVIAFSSAGAYAGISAEGPQQDWPANFQLREVRTDPFEMAALLRGWNTNRPAAMRGIIWYRMPVAGDNLNLRWPTLAAIMAARNPREQLRVETRRVESGLIEISLINDGELDTSSRLAIHVQWQDARLIAGDGLRGFELADDGSSAALFQTKSESFRMSAGASAVIGWLRLSEERDVKVELKKL